MDSYFAEREILLRWKIPDNGADRPASSTRGGWKAGRRPKTEL